MPVLTEKPKLTRDRAAARYRQSQELERQITLNEVALSEGLAALHDAKTHVKDLRKQLAARLLDLRGVARDEGELPLLPFVEDP